MGERERSVESRVHNGNGSVRVELNVERLTPSFDIVFIQ